MKHINNIVLYVLIATIIGYLIYTHSKKDKIVYIDNVELFSGFKMKQELEKKYKEVEGLRKSILDSLFNEIKLKVELNKESENAMMVMKKEYLMKKEMFEKENSETMAQYNDQIWNQLNEYTKQFGEENEYDYVLGANGQGVLMYAKDTKNVTKELLEFANKKFNGK
jgi:outer membrane protein